MFKNPFHTDWTVDGGGRFWFMFAEGGSCTSGSGVCGGGDGGGLSSGVDTSGGMSKRSAEIVVCCFGGSFGIFGRVFGGLGGGESGVYIFVKSFRLGIFWCSN